MEQKLKNKLLRREFNSLGAALLLYLGIMNAVVSLVMIVDMVILSARQLAGETITEEMAMSAMMSNGTGYILTILIGLLMLWAWKGKDFCTREIWKRGKPMTVADFMQLTCVFVSGQLAFQILGSIQEQLLNLFGLTAMGSIEAATMGADTLSMFLYACVAAPIGEEILFRGLALRYLEPYGKRFAIVMSAFLFGIFHANLVQTPYTFLVGLVLGYVAIEYNILWSMVLHMINNLVLSDMLIRLTRPFGEMVTYIVQQGLIYGCAIVAVIIITSRVQEAKAYVRDNKVSDRHAGVFFTSPGIMALMFYYLASVVYVLIP